MNILVVDEHPLVRRGITALITESFDLRNVYEADDVPQTVNILHTKKLDIVLLALGTQQLDGFYLLRYIRSRKIKKFRIIVITVYNDPLVLNWLQHNDVEGYVSKANPAEDIIDAINAVSKGYSYYPEAFQRHIAMHRIKRYPSLSLPGNDLEILSLIANGYTSKQIAARLGYTLRSVETKRLRLERKLSVKNSAELVSVAYRTGLLKVSNTTAFCAQRDECGDVFLQSDEAVR